MSLDFVAGAVFTAGVLLIGSWLRDRWRYRLGSGRTLPPPPPHDTTGTDIDVTPPQADVTPAQEQPWSAAEERR